jgi:hypothetical protein
MAVRSRGFWLVKRDNAPEEYEDALAADPTAGRFALADGAAQSSFAQSWAQLLVDDFVAGAGDDAEQWGARLPQVQDRWRQNLPQGPLPWYAEVKVQQGAFAAFLGLILHASPEGADYRWQAVAVGDACLFCTREAELLAAFPLDRSDQFNNFPKLLGSRTPAQQNWQECVVRRRGQARPGDRVWMMTDALACWFLAEHEAGRRPWDQFDPLLISAEPDAQFARWIEELRHARRLKNDDVTLLALEL